MHTPDTQLGQDLKDAGCALVLEHTPERWVAEFEQQATALLRANGSFTAEEVVTMIGQPPNHSNAIGAACRQFVKRNGLAGSYEPAKSPSAHGRIITRWHINTF
jgi:hypothetical protein